MANANEETVPDVRENIPLKSGVKKNSWFSFSCSEDGLGGSRMIITSFACLTVAITIALVVQIYYGDYQIVPHGSVATNDLKCSSAGGDILKRGGNAVDAAVTSALCLSVVNPHNTGLDASGIMMIYSHKKRLPPVVIDFTNGSNLILKDIHLPRLVLSLAYVHQKYGKLPWKEIVQPAADLAGNGFAVPQTLVDAILEIGDETLFGRLVAGENINKNNISAPIMRQLRYTLEMIADIPNNRLKDYIKKTNLIESQAANYVFKKYNIHVPNEPDNMPLLLTNLQHISDMNITSEDVLDPQFEFRLAKFILELYDHFNITNETYHQGPTSNIAVIDTDELYVSLVTGLFDLFGSREKTDLGYFLDVKNIYKKSQIPIIITDKKYICGRRIVMGSGDLSTATQIILSLLVSGKNVSSSVEGRRFQIINSHTIGVVKEQYFKFFIEQFKTLGTVTELPKPYSSCNLVEKSADSLSSHSDSRGGGVAFRF